MWNQLKKNAGEVIDFMERIKFSQEENKAFKGIQEVLDGTLCNVEEEERVEDSYEYMMMESILKRYGIEGDVSDDLMNEVASKLDRKAAVRIWNEFSARIKG